MATLKLLVLSVALLFVTATPQPPTRSSILNTIFGDERLKDGAFEEIDSFSDVTLYNDAINPFRLPEDTAPVHYDVLWFINPNAQNYTGHVDIHLVANTFGVSEIVTHSTHNVLESVTLTLREDNITIPITYFLDTQYDFLRVRPNANLQYNSTNPVVYTLSISFRADTMRTDMYGIYPSWFRNNFTDTQSWMATTQFQATAARSAFPCYDEPKFKATFNIVIRRPTTHRSWSCTRIAETVNSDGIQGYQDDIYHQTPVMSTYLLALIVAEYSSQSHIENGLLTYEVIARPSAIESNQGDYAFEVGQLLLAEMSSHTDLDFYSVNANLKMTQAAIPDFGAGAMENWGLLTYREAYVMYDSQHTNSYFKQLIAYILSHEIAHMWFGNLVTNDWWDVLWLNEGFARYYQYFLTHWVETEMGLETRFITEQVHTSLLTDSSNNPQPLTNPGVGSPASVSAMFSTISYNKGAAIIRQTEYLLGHEVHRLGLRNYLRNHAFEASHPIDLFNALQAAGDSQNALTEYGPGFSIAEYYRSWTEQPGHPVLNVNVNHQTGDMTISQRRFNINTGYATNNNLNYIIPITFATSSNANFSDTKPTHILRDSVGVINRGSVGDEWVIFNKQQIGFYRVNYDDYTWDLISLALKGSDRTRIHEFNRAQIVNDVFQFARSGIMSYRRAFNILSFLENETSYAPWVAAATGFSWIRNRLAGTNQLVQLEQMIAGWANTVMSDLGYTEPANEDFMRSYLRYMLAPVMCNIGVETCRNAALNQFRNLLDNGIEVPADSRNWVYCNGLRQGSTTDFDRMWQRFREHNVYTEKILLLQVLGCTPHAASLNIFMAAIVQDFEIRPQDYTTAWNSAVTGNEGNTQIAFNFVQNNLPVVAAAFNSLATPLSYISSRLRTENDIIAFQTWATQNQAALGTSYNAVFNGAENSRESIRWAEAVSPDINEYLVNGDDQVGTTTSTTQAPVVIVTTQRPPLPEIINPTLPSSAATSILSMTIVVAAAAAKIIF